MRIALAQINPTVGAVEANARLMRDWIVRARDAGADLVVFPELAISGYPPKDLLLFEGFVQSCAHAAKRLGEEETRGLAVVFGCPLPVDHGVANSLLVYRDNSFVDYYDKRLLPTYDVFDEDRYFVPGDRAVVVEVAGVPVGLSVCEDLWKGHDAGFSDRYADAPDPVGAVVAAGARLIVNPSASPFVVGKGRRHRELLSGHARRHGVPVAAVNQVGGNDELLFDGHACVFDREGRLVGAAPGFVEHLLVVDVGEDGGEVRADPRIEASAESLVFHALSMGVRDYCRKTGFASVVVAVSGGIDSAVTAAIASHALGADRVTCLAMPGKYSSTHSLEDAQDLAQRLGGAYHVAPIEHAFEGARRSIDPLMRAMDATALGESLPDIAEENVQSRLRGLIVMAHSNRTGDLVLTTGNKSELAVGYCTLYGDMNGGLAVLNDLTKGWVYALARWMNAHHAEVGFAVAPIPQSTIDKAPSAELAPNQRDQDSLPPYDVLDEIVVRVVERHQSWRTIASETGFDEAEVRRCCRMIDRAEYKRKQLATGLKVTGVAFGFGRRMPIARGWAD
ncbi:MAG: NAD+ synthase [Phycisphaeraceae bacterium]|nr:NAD+ synthase [Phycisphaeraceae bacterium]